MNNTHLIIEKFEKEAGIKVKISAAKQNVHVDAMVEVLFSTGKEVFYVEQKLEIREVQLPQIFSLAEKYKPLLIIAEKTYPKIRKSLKEKKINYLDISGNACIQTSNNYIYIEKSDKASIEKTNYARAFTKTGVKVLYHLLINPDDVNLTVRELAGITAVGNDSIHKILRSLLASGYLIRIDKKKYKLAKKEELLKEWIRAYKENLKPKILVGNFHFDNNKLWKSISFKNNTKWGGEPAGNFLTGYLVPSVWTIYTNEKRSELVKNYKLYPDDKGEVFVFEKFWKDEETKSNTVHPLLVYTDLIITEDPRNIETANMIYEKHLGNLV